MLRTVDCCCVTHHSGKLINKFNIEMIEEKGDQKCVARLKNVVYLMSLTQEYQAAKLHEIQATRLHSI